MTRRGATPLRRAFGSREISPRPKSALSADVASCPRAHPALHTYTSEWPPEQETPGEDFPRNRHGRRRGRPRSLYKVTPVKGAKTGNAGGIFPCLILKHLGHKGTRAQRTAVSGSSALSADIASRGARRAKGAAVRRAPRARRATASGRRTVPSTIRVSERGPKQETQNEDFL